MRTLVELSCSRVSPRAAVVALLALVLAGCSSDTTRFDPFTNPPSRVAPGETTGSISAAPVGRVETRPYGRTAQLPPPPTPSRPGMVASVPRAGGGPGMATYRPNADVTGSIQSAPLQPVPTQPVPTQATLPAPIAPLQPAPAHAPVAAVPAASQQWTWDGGTPIIIGSGDTLEGIAHRYGVPASAIAQANSMSPGASLRPGERLVIPRYNSSAPAQRTSSFVPAKQTTVAAAPVPAGARVHVVAPGETLIKIARTYGKPLTEVARANNIAPHTHVNIGDRIVIPGLRTAMAAPAPRIDAPTISQPVTAPAAPKRMVAVEPPAARVLTPAKEQPAVEDTTKTAEAAGALPAFRWPVRGRVITSFGPKPNGQQNDGINLAVPEGTPIKAADDGVVAYAGNELKGYGNLVLVRHPNGYVTAYAHASEVLVKRGDQIKRGQVIARSGQSGNVDAPQLHFEIRKGATPVDPMQFLNGA